MKADNESFATANRDSRTDWHGPAERKRVRPALPGSLEEELHMSELDRFYLDLCSHAPHEERLTDLRLERRSGTFQTGV